MLSVNEILGIIYLQLTGMGVLGNCFLLFLYSFPFLTGKRTKPINLIIIHLAFSNIMLLLFRGIPPIPMVWGVACFLDGLGARIIVYLQVLPRGLSLGITCLLSIFQAIILTPNSSIWAELKSRATKCIIPCILLAWIFNILVKLVGLIFFSSPKNSTESKNGCNIGYRVLDVFNTDNFIISIVIFVHDAILVCLMACSSGYMVFILYRHNQKIKHIHSTSLTPKTSPETRATKTILILVAVFILFNSGSPTVIIYMFYFNEKNLLLTHATILLSLCYPAVSPFILITTDTRMPKTCCAH